MEYICTYLKYIERRIRLHLKFDSELEIIYNSSYSIFHSLDDFKPSRYSTAFHRIGANILIIKSLSLALFMFEFIRNKSQRLVEEICFIN